jgi:glucose-6-phosphate isomerase
VLAKAPAAKGISISERFWGDCVCPTRIKPKLEPIELDLSPALFFERGLGRAELLKLAPQLELARSTILNLAANETASMLNWPRQMLVDYRKQRKNSLLGRILTVARRLRETVDRVVVIGPASLIEGAKALLAAGGHPHHNELTRAQRGERPRIYLLPAVPDNDAAQGLLDILPQNRRLREINERWGLVAVDSGASDDLRDDRLILGYFNLFWDILQQTTTAADETQLAAVICRDDSALANHAESLGLERIVHAHTPPLDPVPIAARCQPPADCLLHPGVLFAASLIGLDVVNVLIGAAAMTDRFATKVSGENPVLDFAALRLLLATRRGIDGVTVSASSASLELLARRMSHNGRSADELVVQCLPQSVRADRLRVTMPDDAGGNTKKRIVRSLPELATDDAKRLRDARFAAGLPTAVVQLPHVDELSLGQLVQMFLTAELILPQVGAKPQADADPLTPDP